MMKSNQQITKRLGATNSWTAGAIGAALFLLTSVLAGNVAHAVTAAGQDCNDNHWLEENEES